MMAKVVAALRMSNVMGEVGYASVRDSNVESSPLTQAKSGTRRFPNPSFSGALPLHARAVGSPISATKCRHRGSKSAASGGMSESDTKLVVGMEAI
ncbi:hypothetical protein MLD38_009466 [Melastoma candidum]|uniref:Uncharacterized protein n=1 Tax=Melastoma candidum TaxID=119954 RepID=A0ACB9RYY5_9MYRT|nr:hypothetical protein MLD38_009466 [Melastoma candidum]